MHTKRLIVILALLALLVSVSPVSAASHPTAKPLPFWCTVTTRQYNSETNTMIIFVYCNPGGGQSSRLWRVTTDQPGEDLGEHEVIYWYLYGEPFSYLPLITR